MRRRVNWWRVVLCSVFAALFLVNFGVFAGVGYLNDEKYIQSLMPVFPPDETPPVVALNGDEVVKVATGAAYHDAGVEAYDIRSEVTVETEGMVNTAEPGEYVLKYIVKDEAGNQTEVERKVIVEQASGVIYLTFDDGPGVYTAELLDVLAKYNVKVTFFVTGMGEDDLIAREYNEGHTVALHTNSHDYAYVYSSVDNYFADLYQVQERVKNITGQTATLIRFPGGSSNLVSARYDGGAHIMSTLVDEVQKRGFTYFDWNVTSGDAGGARTADEVYENVVDRLIWGGDSVVLQHDIKEFSVEAVERIIQYGLEHGFAFARLEPGSFTAHHGVNN